MLQEFDEYFIRVIVELGKLVILSMLIERGLYFIFDYSKWRDKIAGKGVRAPVALAMAWFICWWYDFDIVAALLEPQAVTQFGIFITATIVAGGSATAIMLFQDVMKFSRSARADIAEVEKEKREIELAKLKAEQKILEAKG